MDETKYCDMNKAMNDEDVMEEKYYVEEWASILKESGAALVGLCS